LVSYIELAKNEVVL